MRDRGPEALRRETRIHLAQDYICRCCHEDLPLERVARAVSLSPYYFHREFKRITGETPRDFTRRVRLERACALLRYRRDWKITAVAQSCGFSSSAAFAKAFAKEYGLSPSSYRKGGGAEGKPGQEVGSPGQDLLPPSAYISEDDLNDMFRRRKRMDARIEKLPPCRIAYMRQIGPYGAENYQLMQRFKRWALSRDLLDDEAVILGIARDDPGVTPAQSCRYDSCLVIGEDFPLALEEEVNEGRLTGGSYAVFSVAHTAEAVAAAWREIFTVWLPESGRPLGEGPLFERYTGLLPGDRLEPRLCEICLPLRG